MSVNQLIYLVAFVLAVLVISIVMSLIVERIRGKGRIVRALNMSLFLIKLPQEAQ